MQYLSLVLMPAKKDAKSFKLKDLLEQSYDEIYKILNHDKHALYQMVLATKLADALEAVQTLHPPLELETTPGEQKRLMSTPLTHVILELTDNFDQGKSLKEFAVQVYVLKPEGYPDPDLNRALDEVEARVSLLIQAIDDPEQRDQKAAHQKALDEALVEDEKLKALLVDAHKIPLKFEGPQFKRVYPDNVEPQRLVVERDTQLDLLEDDMKPAQPQPSVAGLYSAVARGSLRRDERVHDNNNYPGIRRHI